MGRGWTWEELGEIIMIRTCCRKFSRNNELIESSLKRWVWWHNMLIWRLKSSQSLTEMNPWEMLHQVHVSMSFQVCINAECVDVEKTYRTANCSSKCKGHAVSLESRYPQLDKPYAISVLSWWCWNNTFSTQWSQLIRFIWHSGAHSMVHGLWEPIAEIFACR